MRDPPQKIRNPRFPEIRSLEEFISLLPPDIRHSLSIRARAELAKRCAAEGDVLGWGAAVCPEKFVLPFCDLHKWITDNRKAEVQSLAAPRGHAKTTVGCTLVPLYQGCEEPREPYNFYLNVQANDDKALSINRTIKSEYEENPVLRHLYGNLVGFRWTDAEFITRKNVVYKAVGAGVSIRGIQVTNRRPDYVIADDLYSEDEIRSRSATLKINDWAKSTLFKTLARGRQTVFKIQGTVVNKSDLLNEMPRWPRCVSKIFKAETGGVPLWPALYTIEQLNEERGRLGSTIYNREMQNVCTDDSEAIVKSAWLGNWLYDPAIRWAKGFTREFSHVETRLGVDPSIGATDKSDFTGAALVVVTGSGTSRRDFWIEGIWNERLSQNKRIELLQRIQAQRINFSHHPRIDKMFLESVGAFQDFSAEATRVTSLPITQVKSVKNKLVNLENKSGHFEGGRVHLSSAIAPEMREKLIEQLTTNDPDNDDVRDGLLLTLDDPTVVPDMRKWVMG